MKRFWNKIKIVESGCWEWTAAKNLNGYGYFSSELSQLAHRYSYSISIGEIPKGMYVLHRCDNPACVNPLHLFLGTHRDNMDDKVRKKRQARFEGTNAVNAKLNESQVQELRRTPFRYGMFTQFANRFGVSLSLIARIYKGKRWKHVANS